MRALLPGLAGALAGVAWSRSGLWVNLLHLTVGSLLIGIVVGQVASDLALRRFR